MERMKLVPILSKFGGGRYSLLILGILLGIMSIVSRYPQIESENYICSDATWHTLLTIEAYNETPISVHKFLPIVSLGDPDDKYIGWGSTIPDSEGNYYYTSFSPMGYVAPWIFMKVFDLPINEQSLYLFNSILYLCCFVLWAVILLKLFSEKLPTSLIIAISALYLVQPEILHSQGIVYWHQSLFQLIFLAQILLFLGLEIKWKNMVLLRYA